MSAEKEKTEIEIKISSYKGLSPVGQLVVISLNFLLFFALPFRISPTFCICFIHICKQSFRSIQLLGEEANRQDTKAPRLARVYVCGCSCISTIGRIESEAIRGVAVCVPLWVCALLCGRHFTVE